MKCAYLFLEPEVQEESGNFYTKKASKIYDLLRQRRACLTHKENWTEGNFVCQMQQNVFRRDPCASTLKASSHPPSVQFNSAATHSKLKQHHVVKVTDCRLQISEIL